MSNYTITLTETEDLAMQYTSISVDDWIQNVVHDRARIAVDEIVQIAVQKCLENGVPIPSTKDEIVSLAFDNGWVKTAEQRHQETVAVG